MSEKKNDSQLLSRADLFSLAIGQVIGVGVMTMTGAAIGFTGRSVSLAFIIAGILTIISTIPQIFIGGTANFLGGQYSQIAYLGGKKPAGIYTYVNISMVLAFSMYTLSFGEYFVSLVPGANGPLVGLVAVTAMFILHLTGIKQAARLQNIMSVVLALALAAYVAFGVGSIQPEYFDPDQFMTGGPFGLALASVFLTFACGGANYVVNFSAQAKNPAKDVPFVIIVTTIGIVALYAVMATIAAGVLPVAEVAGKPLSVSAAAFMPGWAYTFFVVGGAMFALLTTLNFTIGMFVNPVIKACDDGWLPKGFAAKNEKFGTHHWILLFFYLITVVPIIIGLDLNTIANSTVIIIQVCHMFIAYAALFLPVKMPQQWAKSKFHVSDGMLKFICGFTVVLKIACIALLLYSTDTIKIILNLVMLGAATVLMFLRQKKVTINPSFVEF